MPAEDVENAQSRPEPSPEGLGRAFARGLPALVVYLMAGYPDRAGSLAALGIAAAAGADLIELGVPYADPLADGPAIREAADIARAAEGGFGLAETISKRWWRPPNVTSSRWPA